MIKYYTQVVYRPIGHVTSAGREFFNNRNNIFVCWYWRYLNKSMCCGVRRLTFAVVGWSPPRHPVYCDGEDDVVVGDGVVGVVGGAADVRCC